MPYRCFLSLAVENTHSVAADSENNHVFVPDRGAQNQGIWITVYAEKEKEKE